MTANQCAGHEPRAISGAQLKNGDGPGQLPSYIVYGGIQIFPELKNGSVDATVTPVRRGMVRVISGGSTANENMSSEGVYVVEQDWNNHGRGILGISSRDCYGSAYLDDVVSFPFHHTASEPMQALLYHASDGGRRNKHALIRPRGVKPHISGPAAIREGIISDIVRLHVETSSVANPTGSIDTNDDTNQVCNSPARIIRHPHSTAGSEGPIRAYGGATRHVLGGAEKYCEHAQSCSKWVRPYIEKLPAIRKGVDWVIAGITRLRMEASLVTTPTGFINANNNTDQVCNSLAKITSHSTAGSGKLAHAYGDVTGITRHAPNGAKCGSFSFHTTRTSIDSLDFPHASGCPRPSPGLSMKARDRLYSKIVSTLDKPDQGGTGYIAGPCAALEYRERISETPVPGTWREPYSR